MCIFPVIWSIDHSNSIEMPTWATTSKMNKYVTNWFVYDLTYSVGAGLCSVQIQVLYQRHPPTLCVQWKVHTSWGISQQPVTDAICQLKVNASYQHMIISLILQVCSNFSQYVFDKHPMYFNYDLSFFNSTHTHAHRHTYTESIQTHTHT